MDEEKEVNTVDELVKDITAERDKYKALYEKERDAHAMTLRKKMLGGTTDGDEDEDEDEDEERDAVRKIREKYQK